MSAYRQGEFHAFEGGGNNYLYLVPSAAIFALEDLSSAVLDLLKDRELTGEQIVDELLTRGFSRPSIEETLDELHQAHAIAKWRRLYRAPARGAAATIPASDGRHERDQSMQSELFVLLRIRRRSHRDSRGQDKVHERGDRSQHRGLLVE